MNDEITALPLYPYLDEIAGTFAQSNLLLLSAEPGAGKTTLVPWKLLQAPVSAGGKILLLEPRRIAARAAAERIASLLGEELGNSVGLRTRHETILSPRTRLEVVTEGVLVRIIQDDPLLEGYRIIIFDEFHERNLPAELALALAWDCRSALRNDLSIMVMSATLPAGDFMKSFGEVFTGTSLLMALEYRLDYKNRTILDSEAPERITLPSGTSRAVDYESGDVPVIAARLQEFFGRGETPIIGGEPALLHLLNPAGRPVQITRDLKGFWERSYAEVRKELRGRYPRHYWPENPLEAVPTARAKPRKR